MVIASLLREVGKLMGGKINLKKKLEVRLEIFTALTELIGILSGREGKSGKSERSLSLVG